jgi:hypothetical protein
MILWVRWIAREMNSSDKPSRSVEEKDKHPYQLASAPRRLKFLILVLSIQFWLMKPSRQRCLLGTVETQLPMRTRTLAANKAILAGPPVVMSTGASGRSRALCKVASRPSRKPTVAKKRLPENDLEFNVALSVLGDWSATLELLRKEDSDGTTSEEIPSVRGRKRTLTSSRGRIRRRAYLGWSLEEGVIRRTFLEMTAGGPEARKSYEVVLATFGLFAKR